MLTVSTTAYAADPTYIEDWAINSFEDESGHTKFYMYSYDENANTRIEIQLYHPWCAKEPSMDILIHDDNVTDTEKPVFGSGTIRFENGVATNSNYMIVTYKHRTHITFHKINAFFFISEAEKATRVLFSAYNNNYAYKIKGFSEAFTKIKELCSAHR